MFCKENNLHTPPSSQTNCTFSSTGKTSIITVIAIGAIAAVIIGLLNHFHVIEGLNAITKWTLIGAGSFIALALISSALYCRQKGKKTHLHVDAKKENISVPSDFTNVEERVPKGFLKSPYSLGATFRFLANHVTNGFFSVTNPDHESMKLLKKEGAIPLREGQGSSSLKVVFLGDIMVSKSGNPPTLNDGMKQLLESAQVIVANVEAPVIASSQATKRSLSLKFEMSSQYLKSIYDCNPKARWVFSIANNHACDTSDKSEEDVEGVQTTIDSIKSAMPNAEIIGAEIGDTKPVFSLQIEKGPNIGFLAWTEVMNNDKSHYKKMEIIRETDLTEGTIALVKSKHDILIGFPHGNEEQSYHPLKETRDRWCGLMGSNKFDLIVGHGPHVVHPAELVKGRALFHSIGNFCSPVGRSQTRLGCIPEIDISYDGDGKPIDLRYKVNLLEQQEETVSLLTDIDETATLYPEIITRFRTIWGSLFSK